MGILTRRNIRKAKGLYPRPPCDCREVFSCGEGLPRQAVTQPTDKRHSRPSGASSVVKGENEIRACSPDRVFVMKNRTFVEFISKIRAAWLFLHIANKKLVQNPGHPASCKRLGRFHIPVIRPAVLRHIPPSSRQRTKQPTIPTTSFTERSGLL